MRRVLAIGLAVLVVTIAARGVVAQEDTVSDRLLEILKERQIISSDEYGELKDLAGQMQEDRAQVSQRLGDLDRSIADYLAQGGDAMGANVSYKKGHGFGFMTGDGLFAMYLGGVFQFEFTSADNDNSRDTNGFDIDDNRIILQGHAFDPNLTYYFEYEADGSVSLLDAYLDFNVCDWSNLRVGQFKTPYGRQQQVHESDRAFMGRGPVAAAFNPDRDLGLMFHDVLDVQEGGAAVVEYAAGIWNGEGRNAGGNENNRVAWATRLGIYPMGFIPYVEGIQQASDDVKFGIAGTYGRHKTAPSASTTSSGWEIDGVLTFGNLFATGEVFKGNVDLSGAPNIGNSGWYGQFGYMIDEQNEIVGRYGKADFDEDGSMFDDMTEWSVGLVHYWDGHHWKIGAYIGKIELDSNDSRYYDDLESLFLRIIFQLEW